MVGEQIQYSCTCPSILAQSFGGLSSSSAMAPLLNKVVYVGLFIYLVYEVAKSYSKYQLKESWSHSLLIYDA